MADANPWSLEGWNITAQSAYLRAHGAARAEARARDAGTTLGGPPPAPKAAAAPRDTSKTNPWSAAGWNRTAQAQYIAAHGLARAEARARDAGSTLLGQPAPAAGKMAPAALIRPGSPAIYKVPGAGTAFVPPRRRPVSSGVLPRVAMALGLTEAAPRPYTEQDLAVAVALGLAEAVTAVQAGAGGEVDVPTSTDGLGITMAAAMRTEADLAASAALGITVAAAVRAEADLAASAALGVAMAATIRTEQDLAASAALGITVAAAVRTEADLAASAALGISMASAVRAEADLAANVDMDLGVTVATTLRTEARLAAAPALGVTAYTVAANVIGVSTFFDVGGAHIELQVSTTQGLSDGDVVTVVNMGGTVEANGTWTISIPFPGVSGFINLLGSPPPVNAFTSGGQVLDAGMLYTEVDVGTDSRITEAGDTRITQGGDVRVLETNLSMVLGITETVTPATRVATDGTGRVTTDGTPRVIVETVGD